GEFIERLHQAVRTHLDRMQTLGHAARQGDRLLDIVDDAARVRRLRNPTLRKLFRQHMARERGTGEVLTESVVQILPDSALFALADLEKVALQALTFRNLTGQRLSAILDPALKVALQPTQPPQEKDGDGIEAQADGPIPNRYQEVRVDLAGRH